MNCSKKVEECIGKTYRHRKGKNRKTGQREEVSDSHSLQANHDGRKKVKCSFK
jgi:hypothetical protein